MKRCTRVGINVTKRCNWNCQTCFYRWAPDFNKPFDKSLNECLNEAIAGKKRGCDHVVLVGWGEPSLWPFLIDYIKEIRKIEMTISIITNGSISIGKYEEMRLVGLDHLHISVHGINNSLDAISGAQGSGQKQQKLMQWLKAEEWPWRMNMTVQQQNYKEMRDISEMCMYYGCKHIISLGFLPLYEWNAAQKLKNVAVHPAELRQYIEMVADRVIMQPEVMLTIRYHPMCHISEKYRKYIVNARYILYDPWEWEYCHQGISDEEYWKEALSLGASQSIVGPPCCFCDLNLHCGGWNRFYAQGYDGAGLDPVLNMPEETKKPGWYHDQNSANAAKGYFL